MTKREVLSAIVNGTINEEVIAWAGHELEKMDSQNEKRRNAVSKKALENAPLIDRIVDEILGDEPKTASDVCPRNSRRCVKGRKEFLSQLDCFNLEYLGQTHKHS